MIPKAYNSVYSGSFNSNVAFPLGGIGAGMFCMEGTGTLSHFSIRNTPEVNHEPLLFSAISIKGKEGTIARVLEGQVPSWKVFRKSAPSFAGAGNGLSGKNYGLPRFEESAFLGRFPFGSVELRDPKVPVEVQITGWSPFIPQNADDSSLPAAGLEFTFTNPTGEALEAVYSFHSGLVISDPHPYINTRVMPADHGSGYVISQSPGADKPWEQGAFCAATDHPDAKVDCAWFRGGWFDALTMVWNTVEAGLSLEKPPLTDGPPSPGASIYIPFTLEPHESKSVRIMLSWYVPVTNLTAGVAAGSQGQADPSCCGDSNCCEPKPNYHKPWYAGRFADISDVAGYWKEHYGRLREESVLFRDTFFATTMPPEAIEAVAANLSIMKSPTVLRQADGKLWGWEGCFDQGGCCHGSCTHVWNYAQSIPHLFPELERTLRASEFGEGQNDQGHQNFRIPLPILPADHKFHIAADGQLGGIMKMYRDWRISGDTEWLRNIWPKVKSSLHYCIDHLDPDRLGILIEPHHNTYDIEFWGPDGMCSSFYLGALKAAAAMAQAVGDSAELYDTLYRSGKDYLENTLFNGEYFEQKVIWEGLRSPSPTECGESWTVNYSPEAVQLQQKEGPKYQYGPGCLSDGVIGAWMAEVCGLGDILDPEKVRSHLLSVYRYNLKRDLFEHANPQRPGYALGHDGGLLLCTWPKGGKPSLPFVYSDEVWTGIEYQVASHLMAIGCVEEGLDIVRICRDRYDGRVRNPFDEYECGHWYARAMASYAILQGWSGIRYDRIDRTLYIKPKRSEDYTSFLSTEHGYGLAGMRDGQPFVDVVAGRIEIEHIKLL